MQIHRSSAPLSAHRHACAANFPLLQAPLNPVGRSKWKRPRNETILPATRTRPAEDRLQGGFCALLPSFFHNLADVGRFCKKNVDLNSNICQIHSNIWKS